MYISAKANIDGKYSILVAMENGFIELKDNIPTTIPLPNENII